METQWLKLQGINYEYYSGKKTDSNNPWITEASMSLVLPQVQLSQLNPSETGSAILICQNGKESADLLEIRTSWKLEHSPEIGVLPKIKELSYNSRTSGLQIEFDFEAIYSLYTLLSPTGKNKLHFIHIHQLAHKQRSRMSKQRKKRRRQNNASRRK